MYTNVRTCARTWVTYMHTCRLSFDIQLLACHALPAKFANMRLAMGPEEYQSNILSRDKWTSFKSKLWDLPRGAQHTEPWPSQGSQAQLANWATRDPSPGILWDVATTSNCQSVDTQTEQKREGRFCMASSSKGCNGQTYTFMYGPLGRPTTDRQPRAQFCQ